MNEYKKNFATKYTKNIIKGLKGKIYHHSTAKLSTQSQSSPATAMQDSPAYQRSLHAEKEQIVYK